MAGEKEEMLKTHFVLIHGICGGAWSWFKVKCQLELYNGFKATCLDLRGCGIDPTDCSTIHSFDEYNQPLEDFMAALPEYEKVILVGYSAGGLSVTKALHMFPSKIKLVVYIAATMLKSGFQTPEDLRIGAPDFANHGSIGDEKPNQPETTTTWFTPEFSPRGSHATIFLEGAPDFANHGSTCDEKPNQPATTTAQFTPEFSPRGSHGTISLEDRTLSIILARPGPIGALQTASWPSTEAAEKVPRAYIKTNMDTVMKPEQQEAMISRWPPKAVYDIDTDHHPQFSSPLVVAAFILQAVASFT